MGGNGTNEHKIDRRDGFSGVGSLIKPQKRLTQDLFYFSFNGSQGTSQQETRIISFIGFFPGIINIDF